MDLNTLLRLMVEKNASDLILSVGANIGIKIEGQIAPIKNTKLHPDNVKELAYSVMSPNQVHLFEEQQVSLKKTHDKQRLLLSYLLFLLL